MQDNRAIEKKVFGGNENYLGEDYSTLTQLESGSGTIHVGIDAGSTENRLVLVDDDEMEFGDIMCIDSDMGLVGDISNIKSPTKMLYDNLEIIVSDITYPDEKKSKILDSVKFVKGGLMNSVNSTPLLRPSGVSKVDLDVTYLNILVSMTTAVLAISRDTGTVLPSYNLVPSITLPPEDFRSNIIINKFKRNLEGLYRIELPRLGIKFNIKIDATEIHMDKESDAVIYGLSDVIDDFNTENALIVDGGGKSIDISITRGGEIVAGSSNTFKYGGQGLVQSVIDEYIKETGNTEPPMKAVEAALKDGNLERGQRVIDILPYIKAVKEDYATAIYNDILVVLDKPSISLEDLNTIVMHGRLFSETERDGEKVSISQLLANKVMKVNKDIEKHIVIDTTIICRGVVISRWVDEEA